MPGIKITIPTAFTDGNLPILRDDPLLTAGSLLLLDPAHPVSPMAAGVPADGGLLPNLAWKEAAAAIGSGDQTTLSPTLRRGAGLAGTKGLLERSGKGGIHGIVSQSVALASADGAMGYRSAALSSYLTANKNHRYYFSFWDRMTRVNSSPGAANTTIMHALASSSTSNLVAARGELIWNIETGANAGARPPSGATNTAGSRMMSIATAVNLNAAFGGVAQMGPCWGAPTASYNAAVLASRNSYWPSFIFYRCYVEDLTVSGRTYAQVDALDFAEYTKQVLTAGGRYYGDTFTDPATLP